VTQRARLLLAHAAPAAARAGRARARCHCGHMPAVTIVEGHAPPSRRSSLLQLHAASTPRRERRRPRVKPSQGARAPGLVKNFPGRFRAPSGGPALLARLSAPLGGARLVPRRGLRASLSRRYGARASAALLRFRPSLSVPPLSPARRGRASVDARQELIGQLLMSWFAGGTSFSRPK
jgi:hypothetical protein